MNDSHWIMFLITTLLTIVSLLVNIIGRGLMDLRTLQLRLAKLGTGIIGIASFLAIIGRVFGISSLYKFSSDDSGVAIETAVLLLLGSVSAFGVLDVISQNGRKIETKD